MGLAVLCGFRA